MGRKMKQHLTLAACIVTGAIFSVVLVYFGLSALITCAGQTDTSVQENRVWCIQNIILILIALIPFVVSVILYRRTQSPAPHRLAPPPTSPEQDQHSSDDHQ